MNPYEFNTDKDFETIGRIFYNLEMSRILAGHKTVWSTLLYTHGMEELPHFIFVRDIILRETRKEDGFYLERKYKYEQRDYEELSVSDTMRNLMEGVLNGKPKQ